MKNQTRCNVAILSSVFKKPFERLRILFRRGLPGCWACLLGLLLPLALHADPLPANSKVLVLGPAADTHATALQGLIDGDTTASSLNITVDSIASDDLLVAFFDNRIISHTVPLAPTNAYIDKLREGYDVILIHPGERHIRLCPALFMEAARWVERTTRDLGSRIALIVPTLDREYVHDYKNPTDFTQLNERVYRIKDALELEAIPVGITWETVMQDSSISAANTPIATPNTHAVNVYATTLFSALLERSPAQSSYRHDGIDDTEFDLISAHAHQTWQDALTATHYTGDYEGLFSPLTRPFDHLTQRADYQGQSTEGMTFVRWQKIYERKGTSAPRAYDLATGPEIFASDPDFFVTRIIWRDWVIQDIVQPNTTDLRHLYMPYKLDMKRGLSMDNEFDSFYNGNYRESFKVFPYKRFVPNDLAYCRWQHELPGLTRFANGDSHMVSWASMLQASLIYTMTTGEHPLEDVIDWNEWRGPARFTAALGYVTVMGVGRLAKVEVPPVSSGHYRQYLDGDQANAITLAGVDFDGLPLTTEIVTAPQHGTLEHVGGMDFIYTPDPGFGELDTVTYQVTNGTRTSHPLTITLVVEPFVHAPTTKTIVFEEDFDDMDVSDWDFSGETTLLTATTPRLSDNLWGDPAQIDGTAALLFPDSYTEAELPVSTTGFENLELTVRMGLYSPGISVTPGLFTEVKWFDGSEWHLAASHGNHSIENNMLLYAYQVSLPPEAANNEHFRLRLVGGGASSGGRTVVFDSIRLTGDILPLPPIVEDMDLITLPNEAIDITLPVSDLNIHDTLSYSYTQPANGTVTGTAPELMYIPDTGYLGVDPFTYTVSDGTFTRSATVSVRVRTNAAPVVDAGDPQTISVTSTGTWTPEAITTAAWYDADDTSTIIESEGLVSEWRDKSDHGRHVAQSDDEKKPENADRTLNGLNALEWDGADGLRNDAAAVELFPVGGDVFMISVVQWDTESGDSYIMFAGSENSTGHRVGDTTLQTLFGRGRNSSTSQASVEDNLYMTSRGPSIPAGSTALLGAEWMRSPVPGIDLYVDGTLHDSTSGDTAAAGIPAQKFVVGALGGFYNGRNFRGLMGEMILVHDVTADARRALEGYLAHKWGVTDNLPADHPYLTSQATMPVYRAQLSPTVSDPDNDPMTYAWSSVSGPKKVLFDDPTDPTTTVDMTGTGSYVFRLTVDDGITQSFHDVTVTVTEPDVDDDTDGIADAWELANFDTLEDTDGTGDADTDGHTDFWEYITGSNPRVAGAGHLNLNAGRSAHNTGSVFKWTVKDGFVDGQHYIVLYSTDLSGWTPMPTYHYTITPNVVDGMNEVEMEVTHDYGPHIFITLDKP